MLEHKAPVWDGDKFNPTISPAEYRRRCQETTEQQLRQLTTCSEFKDLQRAKRLERFQQLTRIGTSWNARALLASLTVATVLAWCSVASSPASTILMVRSPPPLHAHLIPT